MLLRAVRRPPFRPIAIAELDLTEPDPDLRVDSRYRRAWVLVRVHGSAVGAVTVSVTGGRIAPADVRRRALDQVGPAVIRHLVADALAFGIHDSEQLVADLSHVPHAPAPGPAPTVTVAVCTRDRADDLRRCLAAIARLDPAPDEILVVDNASQTAAAAGVVAAYPAVRYVCEPRPGLDRARSRAAAEATSAVVAFTDDDVIVDRRWVGALQRAFAEPEVAALTGLVLPYEIETEAQLLFERYGGFGRGFERRWYRVDTASGQHAAAVHGGTGKFGTGANMAFRRAIFDEIGTFDPALDVGTPTNGGGDLEMFFRVLASGHVLVYEPDAIVWHRHRRTYGELRGQLENNGIGFYSYLVRGVLSSPRDRWPFVRLGAWWLWFWNVRRLLKSFYKPGAFPRDLIVAELAGSLRGLSRYQRSRREMALRGGESCLAGSSTAPPSAPARRPACECRVDVDIAYPVQPIECARGCPSADIAVSRGDEFIGTLTIANARERISESRLRDAVARTFGAAVLGPTKYRSTRSIAAQAAETVARDLGGSRLLPPLDDRVSVSIVIATRNRPADLRRALASIEQLRTRRRVEVIVVDNEPESGLTPPAVAEFPSVHLLREARAGLSYARNAGIAASAGDIIVATDDDVVVSRDWLERLVAPFADPEVAAVTGNVLPWGVSSRAERLFELYGGLGRGPDSVEVDDDWFWSFRRAVPTWTLGGTASAAFRAAIFADAAIGMLNEALGAGTPAGCSEDTDLFYRILHAGSRIAYRGDAIVWHRHRPDMRALRRQLYAYAKGHVAYQLTTLVRDGDRRASTRLAFELPAIYLKRAFARLTGRSEYPLQLVAVEVLGTLAGPFAWWRSRRRVRRLGPGARYVAPPTHADVSEPPPREVLA